MALTEEKIIANANKFFKTGETYGFMNNELMEMLGTSFVGAPASTASNLHNAFEGGLIDHILRVTKYAVSLNDTLPELIRVDKKSLVKVCCLHQIGKAKLFKSNDSKWHNDRGIMYDFNDKMISMSVGERSAHYALSYGVELTEEEFQAIVNHAKDSTDKQAKWHSSHLAVILRQSIELAILEEQAKLNNVE